ncbi:TfdA family Taurine catabolism dioxygenase TauD [Phlyctema vagabunda]|uniref:TfdA family Taurine catabolism dioxygenase TauD n=1 Tax=Phlyctema vagabunda TaxID=108571 RepID=A0ABR4P5W0_9HELO
MLSRPTPRVLAFSRGRLFSRCHAFRSSQLPNGAAPRISRTHYPTKKELDAKILPSPYPTKKKVAKILPSHLATMLELPGDSDPSVQTSWLRDACRCAQCVDPSTQQKNFQTSDIPQTIKAQVKIHGGDMEVRWEDDVKGYDDSHVSSYSAAMLASLLHPRESYTPPKLPVPWDSKSLAQDMEYFNYDDYQESLPTLHRALQQLKTHGIVIVQGTPHSELSVEKIANRIGNVKETLYGRTWDVRSVPDAKNVAYTSKNLGLHQDLLYTFLPPGFQLLHCLENSCEGGLSVFSDGFKAARQLSPRDAMTLSKNKLNFQYKNDGHDYTFPRPVLVRNLEGKLHAINWSPPFQGPSSYKSREFQAFVWPRISQALQNFASRLEDAENVFEYRLQKGDCVIFDNRRLVHGRTAFDTAGGERWLKGTYIDSDVYESKARELRKQFGNLDGGEASKTADSIGAEHADGVKGDGEDWEGDL